MYLSFSPSTPQRLTTLNLSYLLLTRKAPIKLSMWQCKLKVTEVKGVALCDNKAKLTDSERGDILGGGALETTCGYPSGQGWHG